MRVALHLPLALLVGASSCAAFITPAARTSATFGLVEQQRQKCTKALNAKPFFASEPEPTAAPEPTIAAETTTDALPSDAPLSDEEFEKQVEEMVEAEIAKSRKMSNLRNSKGVDYAPWMKMSEEDENNIRRIMKEKAVARRLREEQERSVSGNLYLDSQAQELSGTGLKAKVIDEDVEIEWATKSEKGTAGFIVKRRPAKTETFSTIATFEEWGPLQSKGVDGGVYRYLDTDVAPGGWVYRVSECDTSGNENDLCQCLVEIQTPEEQRAGLIAGVGIGVLAVLAVVAGLVLDPLNGS